MNDNGTSHNITNYLSKPSHYLMTLNVAASNFPFSYRSEEVIIDSLNEELSSLAVIQNYQTKIVTPGTRIFIPPHTNGDKEYSGNGPKVTCWVRLSLINNNTQVQSKIYMHARETKSDWTTASGTDSHIIYTAPTGKRISRIVTSPYDSITYTDTNHGVDTFPRGNGGPVRQFEFIGDTSGDDAGTDQ